MPPGSSYERQTVKPAAACSAANSRTVLPPLTRVSLRFDSLAPKLLGQGLVEDHVQLDAVRDLSVAAHLDPLLGDRCYLGGLHHRGVGIQLIRIRWRAWRGRRGGPYAERDDNRHGR